MKFYLYQFSDQPPPQSPVGMNALAGMGMYLNKENAMKYLRPRARPKCYGGQATTHLGLYDAEGLLVHWEPYSGQG